MLRVPNASPKPSMPSNKRANHFAYDFETGFYLTKKIADGVLTYILFDSNHPRTPVATFSAPTDEYAVRKANAILLGWDLPSHN
jgi:hypothetical protein